MIGKRFDRIDRVGRITGKIPIGWVKKFGLVEVFHAGVSKKLLARSGAIVEWPNRKDRPRFKGKIEQSTMWWMDRRIGTRSNNRCGFVLSLFSGKAASK